MIADGIYGRIRTAPEFEVASTFIAMPLVCPYALKYYSEMAPF